MPDKPSHILVLNTGSEGTFKVLSYIDANTGSHVPMFSITQKSSQSKMEIRRVDPSLALPNQPPSEPMARARFHFTTSKMELNLHGVDFNMKRRSLTGGHFFSYRRSDGYAYPEMQWKSSSFLGSGLVLVDSKGRTVASTQKKKAGLLGGGGDGLPGGIHVMDRIDDWVLMDLISVTGLAAVEYRRQSDKDWDLVKEISGEIGG